MILLIHARIHASAAYVFIVAAILRKFLHSTIKPKFGYYLIWYVGGVYAIFNDSCSDARLGYFDCSREGVSAFISLSRSLAQDHLDTSADRATHRHRVWQPWKTFVEFCGIAGSNYINFPSSESQAQLPSDL